MLSIDNMKISKVFKRDVKKYLGIIIDIRRKDFRQYIAENGGYNNAIETLKTQLNNTQKYGLKKSVREKQVKTQKEYIERKQNIRPKTDIKKRGRPSNKKIKSITDIQRFYRDNKRRNVLFTLNPQKVWNTKYSYNLVVDYPFNDEIPAENNFGNVFQYYKIANFLNIKLNEYNGSYN